MQFHVFGDKEKPALLVMHGIMNNWHIFCEKAKSLARSFYLIFPAMDGFYDGSGDFTSFADQSRQIEEYVKVHKHDMLENVRMIYEYKRFFRKPKKETIRIMRVLLWLYIQQ